MNFIKRSNDDLKANRPTLEEVNSLAPLKVKSLLTLKGVIETSEVVKGL